MQCNIRFSRNIKISPLISFVCRDTQLIFSKACAVAAFIFQAEHGIKVSDMIFKRREIVIPAYTLYELIIKVAVHLERFLTSLKGVPFFEALSKKTAGTIVF